MYEYISSLQFQENVSWVYLWLTHFCELLMIHTFKALFQMQVSFSQRRRSGFTMLVIKIFLFLPEKHIRGSRIHFREIMVSSTLNCFDRSLPDYREHDVLYKWKSFPPSNSSSENCQRNNQLISAPLQLFNAMHN